MGLFPKNRRRNRFNIGNLRQFKATTRHQKSVVCDSLEIQLINSLEDHLNYSHLSHLEELILSTSEKPHIAKRLISTFVFCILKINKKNIAYKKNKRYP